MKGYMSPNLPIGGWPWFNIDERITFTQYTQFGQIELGHVWLNGDRKHNNSHQKVLILDTERQEPDVLAQPLPPFDRFSRPTCVSFLIPIETQVPAPVQVPHDSANQMLQPEPTITDDADNTQEPIGSTTIAPATTESVVQESGSSKTQDILKNDSITSLKIVASSGSAEATLSILALSLTNLIGGPFVLVHHILDLKSEEQSTNEEKDRYYLYLGKRENFYLHVCIGILTFIIFGLVPPIVYGLTFYRTNDKFLTLMAVAGASIICTILLSLAKAYTKRPNTCCTYLKTVIHDLITSVLTPVISYLVRVLIRQLLEKLRFSSESSLGFNLMLPGMSVIEKPKFGHHR